MNHKKSKEKIWTFKEIVSEKSEAGKEKTPEEKRLAQWIKKEIISREYTQKEINTMIYLAKQGKQKEAWKILLKGHKCPNTCYCQKEAKTWQERMNKAQMLLELAEREGNEAEKLRIKETVNWLSQQFNRYHE
ncbi:MAG: hypothetical protein MRERV_72c002 [Mycoplasmataceae bacterium RV_VA103A]|nr:MAG: hypothetical protein MRERV_72c002 [Mycoplasmataceae bacterium RV_VA103A]